MPMSRSPDRHAIFKSDVLSGELFEADLKHEDDEEWKKSNMEYDLRTADWILEKVRNSDRYAQNLYAAMCNNSFRKNEVISILKEEEWYCSWRHSGGIIADMQEKGDYMDWYASGGAAGGGTEDQNYYVDEGIVSDEIRADLFKLGWIVIPYKY